MQSSGDKGIVVFSLGSMIKNITREKANIIASDLAQIPQKVRVHSLLPYEATLNNAAVITLKGG